MVSGAEVRAGAAFIELTVRDGKLQKGLRRAQARLRAFAAGVENVGRTLARTTALLTAPFAAATAVFISYDDQLRKLKAITGATADETKRLDEELKRVGRTTSFTTKQAAEAAIILAKQGFNPEQIRLFTGEILNLARATGSEVTTAFEAATGVIKGFKLSNDDVIEALNILTVTANSSAADVDNLKDSFSFLGPIVAEATKSTKPAIEAFREAAVAIGVLNDAQIKGTRAGTGLARIYKNLSQTRFQDALREINIEVADANGNFRDVNDILAEMFDRINAQGDVKTLGLFEEIFGRGAVSALAIKNVDNMERLREKLKDVGNAASDTAEEMDRGLGGTMRRLLSAIEATAIEIGESLAPVLQEIGEALVAVIRQAASFVSENRDLVILVSLLVPAVGSLAAGLLLLAPALKVAAIALGALSTLAGAAATVFAGIPAIIAALPFVTIIGGVVAVIAIFNELAGTTVSVFDLMALQFQETSFLINFVFGQVSAIAERTFSGVLKSFNQAFGGMRTALQSGDIQLAFEIAVAGIRLIWARVTADIKNAWINVRVTFQQEIATIFFAFTQFGTRISGFFGLIADQIVTWFLNAWDSIVQLGANALLDLGRILLTTFRAELNAFLDIINSALEVLGKDPIQFDADVAINTLEKVQKKVNEDIDAGKEKRNAALRENEAKRQSSIAKLEREAAGAVASFGEDAADEISKNLREVKEAQEALDGLTGFAEVNKVLAEKIALMNRFFTGGQEEQIKSIEEQSRQAGPAAASAAEGFFNPAALDKIFARRSSEEKRTLTAAEKTATNTDTMVRQLFELSGGQLTF